MAVRTQYPNVFDPTGKWVGSFYTWDAAVAWVNGREGFEISYRRPEWKDSRNDRKTRA
jgi:hypothetical protein